MTARWPLSRAMGRPQAGGEEPLPALPGQHPRRRDPNPPAPAWARRWGRTARWLAASALAALPVGHAARQALGRLDKGLGFRLACAAQAAQGIAATGLTPRQAARLAGLQPARLARQLAGRTPLAIDDIAALAGALGVEPSGLVPG